MRCHHQHHHHHHSQLPHCPLNQTIKSYDARTHCTDLMPPGGRAETMRCAPGPRTIFHQRVAQSDDVVQTKSAGSAMCAGVFLGGLPTQTRFLRPAGRHVCVCVSVRVSDQRCGKHELNLHEINFVLENTLAPTLRCSPLRRRHSGTCWQTHAGRKQLGVSQ